MFVSFEDNSIILKGLLLVLLSIIFFLYYYGLLVLYQQPVLKLDDSSLFSVGRDVEIHKLDTIKIDKDYFIRLPDFFDLDRERGWWSKQNKVYELFESKKSVLVKYSIFTGEHYSKWMHVSHLSFSNVFLSSLPIYLTAFLFLLSAISLYIKHNTKEGFVLCLFFCFCSMYFVSAAPMVCRQWSLPVNASRLLINFHYIASSGLIALVHYALIFPDEKTIIKRFPIISVLVFYLYAVFVSFMYLSGYWAFSFTTPIMVIWIVVMVVSFLVSITNERDVFIRKQIALSLVIPIIVGVFFTIINSIPEVLGSTSLQFTLFALFSLVLPFSLTGALDNISMYRYCISLQTGYNQEKEQVRQALHDHTLSSLGHIAYLSDRLYRERHSSYLQQIGTRARSCASQIRDFLWLSGEYCSNWKDMCSFLRNYGYEYTEPYDLEFEFLCMVAEGLGQEEPGIGLKNCLYQCFIEALTNITKHADAKRVQVELTVKQEGISLQIKDDGRGFCEKVANGRHHGLKNIEKRVRTMSGRLNISSRSGYGATVQIYIPIK